MPVSPKEAQNWIPAHWYSRVKYAKVSSGGAVGVVFCWCADENPMYAQGVNYKDPRTADFVVKPLKGGAAPSVFAERILNKIGRAGTPNSEGVKKACPQGAAINYMILKFRNMAQPGTRERQRWDNLWQEAQNANSFLISEVLGHVTEFDYRENKPGLRLRELLADQTLMTNLGRLFAADGLLGNGDRLASPNTGNILFSSWNGNVWTIDSSTVMVNYQAMLADKTQDSWGDWREEGKPHPAHWAQVAVQHGGKELPSQQQQQAWQQGKSPVLAPGFNLENLFNLDAPDNWWDKTFKPHLLKGLEDQRKANTAKGLGSQLPPNPGEFAQAKQWFKKGLEEGLTEIDRQLSGLNWLSLKGKYKEYVKKYGGDPNLDWTSFKVRRMYIKARRGGKSPEQALSMCQSYAQRKVG